MNEQVVIVYAEASVYFSPLSHRQNLPSSGSLHHTELTTVLHCMRWCPFNTRLIFWEEPGINRMTYISLMVLSGFKSNGIFNQTQVVHIPEVCE